MVEFEKCVADIAEYIGLPPREVDAKWVAMEVRRSLVPIARVLKLMYEKRV
ncbi:MAG: hypothetical protein ACLTXI_02720 [Collinsella sp.]